MEQQVTKLRQRTGSDERPGLMFLAVTIGAVLGLCLFERIACRSWGEDFRGEPSRHIHAEEVKQLSDAIGGHRYVLFGLVIKERRVWSGGVDGAFEFIEETPGGVVPWALGFACIGGTLLAGLAYLLLYRQSTPAPPESPPHAHPSVGG